VEPELISKIRNALNTGIDTEQAVVYVLVEIRKLCDRTKYADPNLRVFCNWVAHTDLGNRAEGSTYILKSVDDEVTRARQKGVQVRSCPIFRFQTFRDSLRNFLTTLQLPLDIVNTEAVWRRFIMLYASVVGECPIHFTASKLPLKHISSIELRRARKWSIEINGLPVTRLQWKLVFIDGRHQNISTWGDHLTIIWPEKAPKATELPPHSAPHTPSRPPG
jgi:hypothetical protein